MLVLPTRSTSFDLEVSDGHWLGHMKCQGKGHSPVKLLLFLRACCGLEFFRSAWS